MKYKAYMNVIFETTISEEEIRKHKINWHNVSNSMDNMLGRDD